jgi:peptide/nickel transport system substrate-binding protein
MRALKPALVGSTGLLALAFVFGLADAVVAAEYSESPILAERVAKGELPPVAERLPQQPEIVTPFAEVGRYGGTIRRGLSGSNDHNAILRIVGPQGLTRWNLEWTEVLSNLASRWDVEDEGRSFVFYLRPGTKWSDGEPFTADDVLFNMNDVFLNKEFGSIPSRYVVGGQPVKVEKVDDFAVRFTFAEPYGSFLADLASPRGQHPTLFPKHYCQQFHASYNPDAAKLAAEAGVATWQALFTSKCGDIEIPARWGNPDKPTLDPWVITEPYVGGAVRVVLERNPYFWQVDTEGQQLPYVDRVENKIFQNPEALLISAIGGEIDVQVRHLDNPANRPVLAENRAKGGYEFFEATAPGGTVMLIQPNLTHKDREMRALFNQRDFRIALSLGMDRQQLIDIALLGEGKPWQLGPYDDDPRYNEQLSMQFLEHDPARANALLDGLGYARRDAEGYRLLPSGKRLRFQVDVIPSIVPESVDLLELIERQWAEIGVDMEINSIERAFFFERVSNAYDHDMAVWAAGENWAPGSLLQEMVPIWMGARYGIGWWHWFRSNGAEGVEPPDHIKERKRLRDAWLAAVDETERALLLQQIIGIAADQFEVIGTASYGPRYGIRKANIKNVPPKMANSFDYATPAPALPQQFFYSE